MLVATMTPDQIYEEIITDVPNMILYLKYKQPKFRKMVLRSQLFPVRAHSLITTVRKNNWLLLFSANSKKDVSGDIFSNCICIQETQAGKFALMRQVTNDAPSLFIFSPHFFRRYAERMGIDLTGIPLIQRFFEENITCYTKKRFINGKEELTSTFKEGVAFCKQIEDCKHLCFVMKTFISYDMKKKDQEPGFAESELIRLMEEAIFTENIKNNPKLFLSDSLLK